MRELTTFGETRRKDHKHPNNPSTRKILENKHNGHNTYSGNENKDMMVTTENFVAMKMHMEATE